MGFSPLTLKSGDCGNDGGYSDEVIIVINKYIFILMTKVVRLMSVLWL